jgi:serine/threonine protein kinase/Tol biopolymer transport system component
MAFAPGSRVGPYELLGVLGEGGMGTVYRAHDPRLRRDVALKVLRADVMADPDRQSRFLQEARAVSTLKHPNIVTVHDLGTEGDVAYMVMELVDGRSLDQVITRGGMPLSDVLKIGAQIAEAFASAHAAHIIHRDLKPANVMLQEDGRVKVLDFGLAKLIGQPDATAAQTATQTAAGMIMGSAAYMSPEQAEGKPLDARSDIFSFGALLYELCTGTRAFRGDSPVLVLSEVLRHEPPAVTTLRQDLPPELARLIARCLRKDPARRVQSMADLKVALDDLREDSASGRISTVPPPFPWQRLSRWPRVGAAMAIVSAAILIAMMVNLSRRQETPSSADVVGQPLPLTSYAGREAMPSFSPDGTQIAFMWNGDRADNADIYVKAIGGGPPLRLTTDPRNDGRPAWSPDGRYIALTRGLEQERFAVVLVPPFGGPERILGQFHTRIVLLVPLSSLAWTTDSKYLFVSGALTPGGPSDILRVSIETGEVQTIQRAPSGSTGFASLSLAPDRGTLAAVALDSSGSRSVSLMSLSPAWEVTGARTLTSVGAPIESLTWTADSRELIYRIAVTLPVPLYRIAVAGGVPVPMAWVGPDAITPAVSAKGRRLAFARTYRDTNIWQLTLDGTAASTQPMTQIAPSSFREVAPHYSPDGKRLAFYSNRSGSIQIWTCDASPRWSADSQRIVFDSNQGGGYQIYEVSADGIGGPKALTTGKSSNFIGAYSPDGKWIYFSSDRSGAIEVWRLPSSGGEPEQVTRYGGQASMMTSDGAWIYFTKKDGGEGLWRVRVIDGVPTADKEERVLERVHRHNFVPTSDGVYFIQPLKPDGSSVVAYFDFASRSSKEVVKLDKPADLGLALSPDGRTLLFTKLDYAGTDLMLVENFR